MRSLLLMLVILFFAASCKKESSKKEVKVDTYHQGELVLLTDDAYKSVAEALSDAYTLTYPDAKITPKVEKEDFALLKVLQKKEKIAILSRELTNEERKVYEEQTEMKYKPAYFAADAVVFIVAKDAPVRSISPEEIYNRLKSNEKTMVFDGANSGNLHFVAQYFKTKSKEFQYQVVRGNENVVREIPRHKDKIGVISLNTFSREYDPMAKALREGVRILPIRVGEKEVLPSITHLRDFSYPFTRRLYFLTNENTFKMANGLMRFASSQVGQLVVEKEGLQPYYLYKREVEMR